MDGWMDERIERERQEGMKRKLTDDGRGRYCPCSGTGDAGPGGGPRGGSPCERHQLVAFLSSFCEATEKGREGEKGKGKVAGRVQRKGEN